MNIPKLVDLYAQGIGVNAKRPVFFGSFPSVLIFRARYINHGCAAFTLCPGGKSVPP
jgi:hypothetical protein